MISTVSNSSSPPLGNVTDSPIAAPSVNGETYPTTETRIVLDGISWETYEQLLQETGEQRNSLFAYQDERLEIMLPLAGHEEPTRLFDQFLAAIVDELELEFRSLGSLTMKNPEQKKGLEPDCCFYIQNEAVVRGINDLDFEVHPPPDLVIEVDNSSTSLDKFTIYTALHIPEIWRLRKGALTLYHFESSKSDEEPAYYRESATSLAFPRLPIRELPQFIEQAKVVGQRAAVRDLIQRVRQVLADTAP
ncbi:MAG: Uma2 family endonuclease [Symploca sp. SIO2B6]|nr:Uma2 family endonuclease [Symploca sp. SIO2B6]